MHATCLKELEPILFLLHINDLSDVTQHGCTLCAGNLSITIPYKDNLLTNDSGLNNTMALVVTRVYSNNLTDLFINFVKLGTVRQ